MKKVLAASAILVFFLSSCLKNDKTCNYEDSKVVAPEAEIAKLTDSLAAHGITDATFHPSGFYYTINNPGTGNAITNLCSEITVQYSGKLFNGNVFDATQPGASAYFQLGGVITGWQKGIALVKAGGSITLYIPPSLAYGSQEIRDQNTGAIIIPANSNLIFEVGVEAIR